MVEPLLEKYLDVLAKEKKITKAKIIEYMDLCMKLSAAQLNIEYADVYSVIHDETFLQRCLKGRCSDLALQECQESCHCFVLDGKCYPREFPNAEKINADPDKYVEGMGTDKLAELVKLASYLYYNFGGGGLTDNTFDAFEYHLKKRIKIKTRLYEKIGAQPIDKIRTTLPYPMASLDKVKPGSRELFDFLNTASKPITLITTQLIDIDSQTLQEEVVNSAPGICWSLKLDGISGLIVYKKGVADKLYTKGDGIIGGDVTYIKEYISLPTIPKKMSAYNDVVVRGEFIMNKHVWKEKYSESYANPRSFVTSRINSGYIAQGIQDLKFVAYEIIRLTTGEDIIPKPSQSFKMLSALGFEVVENGILTTPTLMDIVFLYKKQREESIYGIDGLVLSIDAVKAVITKLENPRSSVAFKMRLEEQIRKTKVLNIEWRITRYGRYIPVAQFESVYIDGARIHRASAFNAAHVRDWQLTKGSVIKVTRSGDVIPTIIDVEVPKGDDQEITDRKDGPIYPPGMPAWHWKGNDIVLDDPDANKTVQIQRMNHFFATIGVPRLREKTLEKLWDAGMKDVKAITNATPEDFIKIRGIGKKLSVGHYNNIHNTMRKTRLDRFIPASTTLALGLGRKLVKTLLRYYPGIMNDDEVTLRILLKKKSIPGIGPKRIENIAENIPKLKAFLFSLNKEDIEYALEQERIRRTTIAEQGYNPKVRGKTFVFTGFFGRVDLELEDYVYDNMGNFASVLSSSIEAVITANVADVTSKIIQAQKLKIPIYTISEFVRKYDIPYSKIKDDDDAEESSMTQEPDPEDIE